ncbi:unnamed protein product [Haemonchus placei]|uniref:LisH domain-containing protein n=1 Tax=Haemonchus placei TaxID=6290 RepID=A0A0N4W3V6_HAEPC|nr:unnamed protein product [Haemonchus placei]
MSFSSSELNHLIWKYLHETGMVHSAFVFGEESQAANSNLVDSEVPTGALVSIVQVTLMLYSLLASFSSFREIVITYVHLEETVEEQCKELGKGGDGEGKCRVNSAANLACDFRGG